MQGELRQHHQLVYHDETVCCDTIRQSDIVIEQGFLPEGCASPGGVNSFQGGREFLRVLQHGKCLNEIVPYNLL